MNVRRRNVARAASRFIPAAIGAWWIWALLSAPDYRLVLERRVDLPPFGPGIPAGAFFMAAPFVALAAFLAAGKAMSGRLGAAAGAVFSFVLIGNALKCLKLHNPSLSYATAGLAAAWTAAAAVRLFRDAALRGRPGRAARGGVTAAFAAAAALVLVIVLFFVPWSLCGDIPPRWNYHRLGPALRSILYADLQGYVNPAGGALRSFRGIRLEGANMRDSVFRGADFRGARMWRIRMEWADFEGADLTGALFAEGKLSFVNFRDADLSGVHFGAAYCMGGDFRGADLRGSNPFFLYYADCRDADLSEARMATAQLFGSDFRGAILRNTDLREASMIRVRLDGADLTGASLAGADMDKAVLRGAILDGADLSGAVRLRPERLAEARREEPAP